MNLPEKLAKIDSLKSEVHALRPINAEQEQRVFQKFRLDWNFNSNAIEGNKLSQGETGMFLLHGLTSKGKPFKDYLDIRGHNEAIDSLVALVRQQEPLTEAAIRELHKILLVESYTVPAITPDGLPTKKEVKLGEYKTLPNHVRTTTGEIHHYASPEETPAMMGDLVRWLREQDASKELHPVAIASIFHHRFTAIHPFDDGNGRLARLLLNLILMQHRLPPVIVRVRDRDAYLFALRKADLGEPDELTSLIADEAINSLQLLLKGARGESVDELDDIDKEVALLKQKLRHIDDPIVLNLEVQQDLFNNSIVPLIDRLLKKLGQFDEFYTEAGVVANGSTKMSNGLQGWSTSGRQTSKEILDEIRKRASSAIIAKITLTFRWSGLKQTPLNNVGDNLQVGIKLEDLKYSIHSGEVNIIRVYQSQLTTDEIREFVAGLCRERIKVIEKHAAVKKD